MLQLPWLFEIHETSSINTNQDLKCVCINCSSPTIIESLLASVVQRVGDVCTALTGLNASLFFLSSLVQFHMKNQCYMLNDMADN